MKGASPSNSMLQRIARIFLKTVLFIVIFILVVILLVQIPAVQNFAAKKVVVYLEKKLQTNVEVGRMYISFPRRITLENIYIEDRQKDTLLSGGMLKVDIDLIKLFSNEVEIKNLEAKNLTAKIRRVLPDTVYNFQFIIDAFVRDKKKTDTIAVTDTTALQMALNNLKLDNIHIKYKDAVAGSDMNILLGHFDSKIDKIDPYNLLFDIPEANIKGLHVDIYQVKPLVEPEPISKDIAEAAKPIPFNINFKQLQLDDIFLNYRNDVSAFYTQLDLGKLTVNANRFDLQNRIIDLKDFHLDNSSTTIRLGRKEQARLIEKELQQELKSQEQNDWRFIIGSLQINNNHFSFDNDNQPKQPYGMDYAHLKGDSITIHSSNVLFAKDSIAGEISKASLREQSGFVLNNLQTRFLYAHNQAYLYDLVLQTPGTELRRDIAIRYPSIEALEKDLGQMQLEATFADSRVKVRDILTFAPQLRFQPLFSNPNETWWLDGTISGSIGDLHMQRLQLRGLQNTKLDISGTLGGLPDIDRFYGNLAIHAMTTSRSDIVRFIPKGSLPKNITLPDRVFASGTINGNMAGANGKLSVNTSLGNVSYAGTFANFTDPNRIKYNGLIKAQNLQLGILTQNRDMIGSVTASFSAKGQGFDPKTASADVDGVIHAAEVNKYNYRNVKFNGSLARQHFNVDASVNDPNINLDITATGDVTSAFPAVKFTANVDSIKTHALNLTPDPLIFRGQVEGDFTNTNPDDLQGRMLITKSLIITNEQRIQPDTLELIAGRNEAGQFLRLNSDIASIQLQGQYQLTQLGTIFQQAIQPYFTVLPAYTARTTMPYDFTFDAYVSDKPVLKALIPDLKQMDSAHISGHFSSTTGWNAKVDAPYIHYGTNHLHGLQLTAGTTQNAIQARMNLSQFRSGTAMHVYNSSVNATVANNTIDFSLNVEDKAAKDKYHFNGLFRQPSFGNYTLSFDPDSLMLNYELWSVNPGNQININQNNITANNFILSKGNQQLSINSTSSAVNAPLDISFTDFKISTVTGFFKADTAFADGTVNGKATLVKYTPQPAFTADVVISDFSMNRDTVGNVKLLVDNLTANTYSVNANITGRGNDIVMAGKYYPVPVNNNSFDFDLDMRQLQLNTIEGMTLGNISNAKGVAKGRLAVSGTFADPDIVGEVDFENAGANITMLNSYFTIDDQHLEMRENGFFFDNFTIRDSANNTAVIDGAAYTGNYQHYLFNLYVTTDNFRALNTTKKDNKLYYGQLYFTSDINIQGSSFQPVVDGSIVINEKTRMTVVLPQPEPGVVERQGIVQFVDMDAPGNDSLFITAFDSLGISELVGFDVSANIEVNKNAEFNLIVDEGNGDFINIKGEALLNAGVDRSGKITLVGSYEIDAGSYELSLNFIKRKFDIQKGSRIVWTGEPTKADIDVTAIYIANAAPLDLVKNQLAEATTTIRNTYLQKLPFEVHMRLEGEMMQPKITFDLVLPTNRSYVVSNDIIANVETRLQQLRQEPSEINKQVFALLLLNRFVGENPFDNSTGGTSPEAFARQSVSKLLTEQLNRLAKDLVAGVELDFDIVSSEDYTTGELRNRTDLNVGLTKRLLNDRLSVSVGSNFELEGHQNSKQQASNIAGNVAVNYQLSKDGRYLLRAYRKNEYQGAIEGYIIETGVGFIITLDYNQFKEIFNGRRIRKKQREEQKKLEEQQKTEQSKPAEQATQQQNGN